MRPDFFPPSVGTPRYDHEAIAVQDVAIWASLLYNLGWQPIYAPDPKAIRCRGTSMQTVVMSMGTTKWALMEGVTDWESPKTRALMDALSAKIGPPHYDKGIPQVDYWTIHHGSLCTQHTAIKVEDIRAYAETLRNLGIHFITGDKKGNPLFLKEPDGKGNDIFQCFTYPFNRMLSEERGELPTQQRFLEIKQVSQKGDYKIKPGEEFRDGNVGGLWSAVDASIRAGKLFHLNIFGEEQDFSCSMAKRNMQFYTFEEFQAMVKRI